MKLFICLAVSCLWRVKEMSCDGIGENSKSDDVRGEIARKLKGDEMDEIKIESDQSSPPEGKAISLKEYSGKRAISKIAKKRGVKYASVTESKSSDYATAKTPDENAPAPPFTTKSIPNRCSACDVAFQFDYHYVNHCAETHWDYTPYGCTWCPKRYASKYALIKHVYKIHDDRNEIPKTVLEPVTCDICGIDVRGWTAFEKHALRAHKGVKMMNCPRCSSKFYRRSYLLVHTRKKHPESDAFQICKHCKIFQNMDTLKDHEECCDAERTNKRKKLNNEQMEEPSDDLEYACGECRGEFDSMKRLEEHYSQQHPKAGMHCCEYCGVTFRAKSFLAKHLDARHPRREKLSKTTSKHRQGKHFVCEYCRGEFVGVTEFEKHGLETHPGQPLFRCRECDNGYATRASFRAHRKEYHEDDGKTRCVNCSKCYYNAWHLRRHEAKCIEATEKIQRLRKEGKPRHYCDVCNKEYYVENPSFKKHLGRHKEYERCKVCNASFHKFNKPNGLANHMKLRHPLNDNIDALLQTIREVETFVKMEYAK